MFQFCVYYQNILYYILHVTKCKMASYYMTAGTCSTYNPCTDFDLFSDTTKFAKFWCSIMTSPYVCLETHEANDLTRTTES
jgi:hypothetical protein